MEAKTPKVLWASTPTPKASSYSFALPETTGKLNAEATTFVPSEEKILPGHTYYRSEISEVSEFHAEAQAVMMAESVLGLDCEPKEGPVGPFAQDVAIKEPRVETKEQLKPRASAPPNLLSKGSAYHQQGQCRPCAWMWKAGGCQNADTCEYCHLCPEGELKHRKKLKIAAIRMGALGPSDKAGTSRRGLKLSSLL